jgi:hypothetical protein
VHFIGMTPSVRKHPPTRSMLMVVVSRDASGRRGPGVRPQSVCHRERNADEGATGSARRVLVRRHHQCD